MFLPGKGRDFGAPGDPCPGKPQVKYSWLASITGKNEALASKKRALEAKTNTDASRAVHLTAFYGTRPHPGAEKRAHPALCTRHRGAK